MFHIFGRAFFRLPFEFVSLSLELYDICKAKSESSKNCSNLELAAAHAVLDRASRQIKQTCNHCTDHNSMHPILVDAGDLGDECADINAE